MIYEIQRLLDDYLAWLKDRTKLREIDDWVEITTPYLDRHNDYLQIYAKRQNGGFLLTDDGYTLTDLEQGGCKLDSRKRQDLLLMTLNGFGVQLRQNALEIHATHETFPLRKHNLVQAMLAVNDMFCLAMPMVASLFHEDVVDWLELHEVRYTPNVKFTGKSGYDHMFDFVIPKSRRQPERILKTINRPNRDNAQVVAFSWIDTKEVRPPDSRRMPSSMTRNMQSPAPFRMRCAITKCGLFHGASENTSERSWPRNPFDSPERMNEQLAIHRLAIR